MFNNVLAKIIEEFVGKYPNSDKSKATFQQTAYWHLNNLRICNMCYLEPFICEFSKYYYMLDLNQRKGDLPILYNKLPITVADSVATEYEEMLAAKVITTDTLGARILYLRQWLKMKCKELQTKREAKINLCCESQLGIIRESKSPHSAPAFYVENKNEIKRGKRRMVINYKKLNEATIGDSYKLPRKDYILEKIKGNAYFSTFDAKSGYWQLRLAEETKPLTAFSCPPQKHYEWNVLPFRLKQAPSIYQQFMDNNLAGLEDICLAYIDDIIVFTKGGEEEHINAVNTVLERIKEKGLILSKKKSHLIKTEVEYLGLKIGKNGILSLSTDVKEKLKLFPDKLEDRKHIQRFLGCINYVVEQGFLANIADFRRPLQKKLSEKTERELQEIKQIVKTMSLRLT